MHTNDLQQLVKDGFKDWESLGDVKVVEHNNMLLFNYRRPTEWNDFERMSRGLILHAFTGEIIARPFDKFFNWMEDGRVGTGHIVTITEKMDGSMGVLYIDPTDKKVKVATRGSFESEQALWATEHLHKMYDVDDLLDWLEDYTFIVEIIYPENRIVVNYHQQESLYLLGVRHKTSGGYMPWFSAETSIVEMNEVWGFALPKVFTFNSITAIIEATGKSEFQDEEGWVVELSDGSRWKFKTDQYRELHKIKTHITPKNVMRWYLKDLDKSDKPPMYDTYKEEYDFALQEAFAKYGPVVEEIENMYQQSPHTADRKTFALWVMKNAKHYSAAMFDLYDKKDPSYLVLDKYVEW